MKQFNQNFLLKHFFTYFRIGIYGAQMHFQKQCHRCVIVNVDPDTGVMAPKGEPLKTLYKYRSFNFGSDPALAKERRKRCAGPPLAINYGIDHPGLVKVGDPVWAVICHSIKSR